MSHAERLERKIFTQKLIKICQRLDKVSVREVEEKDGGITEKFRLRLTQLWVVGSYARGATLCGDLDLVFQVESLSGGMPNRRTMATAFFGKIPYISPFSGTPEENSSGVSFTDAISIWSGVGCDWQSAISAIVINPLEGRATRAIDAIPLNVELLSGNVDQMAHIVSLREQGVLEWEFVPFDVHELPAIEAFPPPCNGGALGWYMGNFGKKTQQLLHLLAAPVAKLEPFGKWFLPDSSARNELQCGSSLLVMGKPTVPIHRLDENLAIRQLLIVPHLTKRGPNGVWLIKRGSHHPDTMKLADKCVYYLTYNHAPNIISDSYGTVTWPTKVKILKLFSAQSAAQRIADRFNEDDGGVQYIVNRAESSGILALTGLAQVIDFDGQMLPIDFDGCRYITQEMKASVSDLASLIAVNEGDC